ncbi:MAG: DOMON-like domain-containing protein [Steroidobacteraceae bacterium]
MRRTKPQTVALACHASSPSLAVRSLTASARIGGAGKLAVSFALEADMSQVVLPRARSPARADELWRTTCFEVFLAVPGGEAYCELNFSPSGEWAMYGFVGYRRGMAPIEVRRPPRVAIRPTGRGLLLEAITYVKELPMPQPGLPLRAGAAAIIEETDGRLSYWALTHPSALPDFHHRLGFVLQIGLPASGQPDLLADAVRNVQA